MKKLFALLTLAIVVALPLASPMHVAAATINYNNVISDVVFDDANSMSASQINTFLNGYPSSCLSTNNGYTFADPTGYSSSTGKFSYGSNVSAGTVFYDAAQAYGINPQVLLATTQKEEGLVEGNGPYGCSALAFSASLGYACTDSGTATHDYSGIQMYVKNGTAVNSVNNTCVNSSSYVGFSRQVINAAWLLTFDRHRSEGMNNWYRNVSGWDNSDDLNFCYRGYMENTNGRKVYQCPGQTSLPGTKSDRYVAWSGKYSIDGKVVTISNGATAALYHYTPHLHGQELFFNLFTPWFGSTTTTYTSMSESRWMQLKVDAYKINPGTGENVDSQLPTGTQIYFSTKITVDGVTYLRTKHDTAYGYNKGIPLSDLEEIPVNYVSMGTPRWMKTKVALYKQDPDTGKNTGAELPAGTEVYFPSKFDIGGLTYIRTQHDTNDGAQSGIPLTDLTDDNVTYTSFSIPRWLEVSNNTHQLDLTGATAGTPVTKGAQQHFDHKVTINGVGYAYDGTPSSGTFPGIPLADLEEIPFTSLKYPRYMVTPAAISKQDPATGSDVGSAIPAGTKIYFPTMINVNGQAYVRTQHDTDNNLEQGILLSNLEENFTNLSDPRYLATTSNLYEKNPTTGANVGSAIPAGTKIYFPAKVDVGSTTYLRSQADEDSNTNAGIPISELEEDFINLASPRYMITKTTVYKMDPTTGANVGSAIPAGTKIYFPTKVDVNGRTYLRTQHDTDYNLNQGILLSEL